MTAISRRAPGWALRHGLGRRSSTMWAVVVGTIWLCGASIAWPDLDANVFPLHVSQTGRYLEDRNGRPFLLQGDAAWGMMVALTKEEAIVYLDDRRERGFNVLISMLISKHAGIQGGAVTNRYGQRPFLEGQDFSSPNEAYFAHVDQVVELAAARGFVVLLAPCYLGYPAGGEGWYDDAAGNGLKKCREYGRWVGARYGRHSNVIWIMGGDRNPGASLDLVDAMALGIRQATTNALISSHCLRLNSARSQYRSCSWLNLNNVYSRPETVVADCLAAFQDNPPMPFFLIEAYYENEHQMTVSGLRAQAYRSLLGGACGHIFGNKPIWGFDTDWKSALNSAGSRSMRHVRDLFESRAWSSLVPDKDQVLVMAGRGSPGSPNQVVSARAQDRSTALAYLPAGHRVRVNLSCIAGAKALIWWFDPRTGSAISEGEFETTSSPVLSPPTGEDWVMVVDSKERKWPLPGTRSDLN